MKGFYLIECVIAMLLMSFVLSAVFFMSVTLYSDGINFRYTMLAKLINLSVKDAGVMGVSYDAQPYASSVLPSARVRRDRAAVIICWQTQEKHCEA